MVVQKHQRSPTYTYGNGDGKGDGNGGGNYTEHEHNIIPKKVVEQEEDDFDDTGPWGYEEDDEFQRQQRLVWVLYEPEDQEEEEEGPSYADHKSSRGQQQQQQSSYWWPALLYDSYLELQTVLWPQLDSKLKQEFAMAVQREQMLLAKQQQQQQHPQKRGGGSPTTTTTTTTTKVARLLGRPCLEVVELEFEMDKNVESEVDEHITEDGKEQPNLEVGKCPDCREDFLLFLPQVLQSQCSKSKWLVQFIDDDDNEKHRRGQKRSSSRRNNEKKNRNTTTTIDVDIDLYLDFHRALDEVELMVGFHLLSLLPLWPSESTQQHQGATNHDNKTTVSISWLERAEYALDETSVYASSATVVVDNEVRYHDRDDDIRSGDGDSYDSYYDRSRSSNSSSYGSNESRVARFFHNLLDKTKRRRRRRTSSKQRDDTSRYYSNNSSRRRRSQELEDVDDDDDDFYDTVQDVRSRKSVVGSRSNVLSEENEERDDEAREYEGKVDDAAAAAASAERERAAYLFEEYQEKLAALNAETERLRRFQWLQEQKLLQKEKEQMRMQQRKQQQLLTSKTSSPVRNADRRSLSRDTATTRARKETTNVQTPPPTSKVTTTNIFQCGGESNNHVIDEDGYEVEIDTSDVDSYQALMFDLQEERMRELQKERDIAEKNFRRHKQNQSMILKERQRRRKEHQEREEAEVAAAAIQPSLSSYSLWSF